jgi:hypothetical protein
MLQLEMTLAAAPSAPGAARQAVGTWFHSRHCGEDATDTAALLVNELVSNAVVTRPAAGSGSPSTRPSPTSYT